MKLSINPISFLLVLFLVDNSAYSLSKLQIKAKCQRKINRSACIKDLELKKLNLLKGNQIEIPVIPYNK